MRARRPLPGRLKDGRAIALCKKKSSESAVAANPLLHLAAAAAVLLRFSTSRDGRASFYSVRERARPPKSLERATARTAFEKPENNDAAGLIPIHVAPVATSRRPLRLV
jgi:hypothetical protein